MRCQSWLSSGFFRLLKALHHPPSSDPPAAQVPDWHSAHVPNSKQLTGRTEATQQLQDVVGAWGGHVLQLGLRETPKGKRTITSVLSSATCLVLNR